VKLSSFIVIPLSIIAAVAFAAVDMARAATQPQSSCSQTISQRNDAWNFRNRTDAEISATRQALADARSPNSGDLNKKVADSLKTVQQLRQTIADLESRTDLSSELPGILRVLKSELPRAQNQLEFWSAKKTQASAGAAFTIHVPTPYLDDLGTRLKELQRYRSALTQRLAKLDREIQDCRKRTQEPGHAIDASWSGTFSDGSLTSVTLTVAGNELSGTTTTAAGGGSLNPSGHDDFKNCVVKGSTATCAANSTYEDNNETVTMTGTMTLTLAGDHLTKSFLIKTSDLTWKHGDLGYTTKLAPGTKWTTELTRR